RSGHGQRGGGERGAENEFLESGHGVSPLPGAAGEIAVRSEALAPFWNPPVEWRQHGVGSSRSYLN
ncbi:MAG: hypothetical protein ACXWI1_09725, partial [Croceibacterium sp.]